MQSTIRSDGNKATALAGRYQGARSRRVARYVIILLLGILLVVPNVAQTRSVEQRVVSIVITLAAFGVCDVAFSRRMGFTINQQGLILHYAFHRKHVPWSNIRAFEWNRWRRRDTEWMWVVMTDDSRTRIPTVARIPEGYMGSFFGSSNLRSRTGEEVDAVTMLKDARAAAQDSND